MTQLTDLTTPISPNWCPGCGDYSIWTVFKNACVKENWDDTNTVIVAGIGCHGHMVNFVKMSSFEGLHGRPLPVAAGIKMVNHRLNVVVFTGDGDMLAEGGNHFIHACRRNHDLTVILHDNAVYGLTTGQTSPVSPKGYKSRSTPEGNIEEPLHPLSLAIASGATFAARVYSGDIVGLTEMIIRAANHKGMAVIDVLQPCVTFNKIYTHVFFQQNIYKLEEPTTDNIQLTTDKYDRTNKAVAFAKSLEWGPKQIPVGVLYEVQQPTLEEQLVALKDGRPLVDKGVSKRDISELMGKYM